jgi:hypothetical protein
MIGEDNAKALNIKWPGRFMKYLFYLLCIPILFQMIFDAF